MTPEEFTNDGTAKTNEERETQKNDFSIDFFDNLMKMQQRDCSANDMLCVLIEHITTALSELDACIFDLEFPHDTEQESPVYKMLSETNQARIDKAAKKAFLVGQRTAYIECLELLQTWKGAADLGLDYDIEKRYPLM